MNKRFQEFSVGRKGNGGVNLATGELIFNHQTTDPDSNILPITVSHVYSSKTGKFNLNLHKTLKPVQDNNPDDTKYIFTDACGTEYHLEQKFFYDQNGTRTFVRPNEVRIDFEGKLTLVSNPNIEVTQETKSREGLELQGLPNKNLIGFDKIEPLVRDEELREIEDEIRQLENGLKEFEFNVRQYNRELSAEMRALRVDIRSIEDNGLEAEQLAVTQFNRSRLMNRELIVERRKKNDLTRRAPNQPLGGIDPRGPMPTVDNPDTSGTVDSYPDCVNCFDEGCPACQPPPPPPPEPPAPSSSEGNVAAVASEQQVSIVPQNANAWRDRVLGVDINRRVFGPTHFYEQMAQHLSFMSSMADGFVPGGTRPDHPLNAGGSGDTRRARRHHAARRASAYFQQEFDELVVRQEQAISDLQFDIETQSRDDQEEANDMRARSTNAQRQFNVRMRNFENASISDQDARYEQLLKITKLEIQKFEVTLAFARFMRTQLERVVPEQSFEIDGLRYGFNKHGELCKISYDSDNNQVNVMYEVDGNKIGRLVDQEEVEFTFEYENEKLIAFKDFSNRRFTFSYSGNNLEKIVYPSGDEFKFIFNGLLLREIRSPLGNGVKLEYDANSRVSSILDVSSIGEESEELLIAGYGSNARNVLDPRSGNKVVYRFQDEYALAEYEVVDGVVRAFGLKDFLYESNLYNLEYTLSVSNRENMSVETAENFINAFAFGASQSVAQVRGNAAFNNFDWEYTSFNIDGNPEREYQSDIIRDDVTRRIEKSFEYREDLLIRESSLVTTNGEEKNYVTTHEYDTSDKPIRTIDETTGIVSETIKCEDGKFRNQSYHRSNPALKFIEEGELSENGRLMSETDEMGNKSTFDYIGKSNIVSGVTNAKGNKTSIGINFQTKELASMSTSADGETNSSVFGYDKEQLVTLESGNTKFEYSHDEFGRRTSVSLNGKGFVQYNFTRTEAGDVVEIRYVNGGGTRTVSDLFDRVTQVYYLRGDAYVIYVTNEYTDNRHFELVTRSTNHLTGEVTVLEYDDEGNLIDQTGRVGILAKFNIDGNVTSSTITVENEKIDYAYDYNEQGDLVNVTLPTGKVETITRDNLERTSKLETISGSHTINYWSSGERTTRIPSSEIHRGANGSFSKRHFTYDEMGNITQIHEAGSLVVRYGYDALNRLVREDNQQLGHSYTYEYDNNGNILIKQKFDFCLDEVLVGGAKIFYDYDGDQLVSFNGEKSKFDEIGNPTTYRDKTLTWAKTRLLETFDSGRVKFEYDQTSIRTRKQIGEYDRTEFFYNEGLLHAERRYEKTADLYPGDENWHEFVMSDEDGYNYNHAFITKSDSKFIKYLYGVEGISGFVLDGAEFSYRKNIQGDITHILDTDGILVVSYQYDAWGNHVVINHTNDNIGDINPFRYRGYYYDTETGLYYLKSRYYDPQTGRFINMDEIEMLGETMEIQNGLNLYVYCGNNPVIYKDPDGRFFITALVVSAIVIVGAVAIGGIVALVRGECIWRGMFLGLLVGLAIASMILTGGKSLAFAAKMKPLIGLGKGKLALGTKVTFGKMAKAGLKKTLMSGLKSGAVSGYLRFVSAWSSGATFGEALSAAANSFITGFLAGVIFAPFSALLVDWAAPAVGRVAIHVIGYSIVSTNVQWLCGVNEIDEDRTRLGATIVTLMTRGIFR